MAQNVQKIDTALKRLREWFPSVRFKATQKTSTTKAKGWGVRIEREQSETTFEPIDEASDDRQ